MRAWLLGMTVAVICLLPWCDNLLIEEAGEYHFSLMLLGATSILAIAVAGLFHDPIWKWGRSKAFWWLAAVVVVSLMNPSHSPVYSALKNAPEQIKGPQKKGTSKGLNEPLVLIETFQVKDKSQFLQTLPQTVNVRRSVASASSLLAAILLGGSIYRLVKRRRNRAKVVCLVILLNGVLISWVGFHFQQEGGRELLGSYQTPNSRFFGSFRYNNFWAAWIVLTIGIGVGLLKDFTRRFQTNPAVLWTLGCLLFVPPLLYSQSRSAILFAIVISSYRFWRFLRRRAISRSKGRQKALRLRGLLIAFVAVVFGLSFATFHLLGPLLEEESNFANRGRMKDTAKQLAELREGGMPFLRPALTRDALKLAAQRPFFGWGLGSFEYAHPTVAGPEFTQDRFQGQTSSYGHLIRARYVHNDWAQALAELGLVGLTALCLFVFKTIRAASAGTRSTSLSHYLMFGCCCTLIMSLWDSPLNNPSIQCLFAGVLALSLATRKPLKSTSSAIPTRHSSPQSRSKDL